MPRIPNKKRVIISIAGGQTEATIPGAQHYKGFTVQFIGLTNGLQIKLLASLDSTNFGVLDSAFTTTTATGTVEAVEYYAPFQGGLKFDLTGNTAAGTIIVSMHDPAYSANNG